jgi:hypothetical protein
MPFARKTSRNPARHFVTLTDLSHANWQVTTEMEKLGLWSEELDDIDVYLVAISFGCYGWFEPDGHIYIPAVTGANLYDLILGHHTRLTDVLRHEWAHALADRESDLTDSKRFTRSFGGSYDLLEPVCSYDPEHHLTLYAATSPCEDFAETFHFYLRHKGRLPQRLAYKPKLIRKWEFVEWMAGKISQRS